MISLPGAPATNLLFLFLGMSTLGESNLGPGGTRDLGWGRSDLEGGLCLLKSELVGTPA
jgi:hypothetical protein